MAEYRLYVWREVLTDNTDGLAVAVARTVEEARELLRREVVGEDGLREFNPFACQETRGCELDAEPEVHELPACAWVYGGG